MENPLLHLRHRLVRLGRRRHPLEGALQRQMDPHSLCPVRPLAQSRGRPGIKRTINPSLPDPFEWV
jgi:hypothetical protein